LAAILAEQIKAGGFIYTSTDCVELALDMKATLLHVVDCHGAPCFRQCTDAEGEMLAARVHLKTMAVPHSNGASQIKQADQPSEPLETVPSDQPSEPLETVPSDQPSEPLETVPSDRWLTRNPFGIPSERETVCEEFGRQVLRAIFVRLPRSTACVAMV
jgi:hypothetical protein